MMNFMKELSSLGKNIVKVNSNTERNVHSLEINMLYNQKNVSGWEAKQMEIKAVFTVHSE